HTHTHTHTHKHTNTHTHTHTHTHSHTHTGAYLCLPHIRGSLPYNPDTQTHTHTHTLTHTLTQTQWGIYVWPSCQVRCLVNSTQTPLSHLTPQAGELSCMK